MKIKTFLSYFLLPTLFTLFSCKGDKKENFADSGKTMGALHISKEKPQPGDTLIMTYQWETGTDEKDPEAFFHYFVGAEPYPRDIDLAESSGKWKGRIVIPDSATAIAINISRNGKIDHNSKKGFVFSLYDDKGELIPGSTASTGYFYSRLKSQYEVTVDSNLVLIKKDLDQYPHLKKDWDEPYAFLLNSVSKDEVSKYIEDRIEEYSKEKTLDEKALANLVSFYNILKNKEKADSIQQIISKQFPLGKSMKKQYVNQFYQASDLSKKEEVYEDYENKFGEKDSNRDKDFMLAQLANLHAENGDLKNFERYLNKISDNSLKASLYNTRAWRMAEKGNALDRASMLSSNSLEILESIDTSDPPQYFTEKQYERNLEYLRNMYSDTYALILFKLGNTKQALKYQKVAVGKGDNSEYNERYLEYLLAEKEYEQALNEATEFIANNSANSKSKEYYKEAYLQHNGSATALEKSLTQLEEKGYEKARRDLQKEILNEEAPDFQLTNLDGNEIILSSLKGKTVILDFWATWCGPCLDAFPGMQMAVDKYKDNKEVSFLFVNTFESGENLNTKVREFLEKNNYSFEVVMDRESEEGIKYKTAKDYDVSGIPTKIIIGPDGKLKFKKLGDSGNSEQIVQELDLMIDILNTAPTTVSRETAVTTAKISAQ